MRTAQSRGSRQSRPAKTFTPPSKDALSGTLEPWLPGVVQETVLERQKLQRSLTDSKQFRGTVKARALVLAARGAGAARGC